MSNEAKRVQAGKSTIPADFVDNIGSFETWTVSQVPAGMVGQSGTSIVYETGAWRSERPIWDQEKCKNCLLCWMNCADSCVLVRDETMSGIMYHHCKGCGVCAVECRFDAMKMVPEHDNHLEPEASAEAEPEITEGD